MIFTYNPQNYSYQNPGGPGGSQYGAPGTVNQNLFNQKSGVNWKDSTAFAYEQMAQREANALNIALMNYQNEYNSPLNQMLRYQQAGINPFDVVNKGSSPAAAPPAAKASQASASYNQEQANKIAQAQALVRGLGDIVDTVTGIKRNSIELKYLDDFQQGRNLLQWANVSNVGSRTDINELGSLKNSLLILALARELGIPLKSHPEGTTDLLQEHLDRYFGNDISPVRDVSDDSLYMEMKRALLDLRKTQDEKVYQDMQESKARERKINTEVDTTYLTGINWLDNILIFLERLF